MRKRFNLLGVVLAVIILSSMGCGNTSDSVSKVDKEVVEKEDTIIENVDVEDVETLTGDETLVETLNEVSPISIMDLFDGEKRVWFFIDYTDSFDGLSYDNDVKGVLITENKQVLGYYYNLIGTKSSHSMVTEIDINNSAATPFSKNRYLLSDFNEFSDEEIISNVSESYGDASATYNFEYEGKEYSYNACTFPYEITYDGELDATGNNLESEKLEVFGSSYSVMFSFNRSKEIEHFGGSFHVDSIIQPSIIKDKEYVGIRDSQGNMLITENTYSSFENIGLDSPDGM